MPGSLIAVEPYLERQLMLKYKERKKVCQVTRPDTQKGVK